MYWPMSTVAEECDQAMRVRYHMTAEQQQLRTTSIDPATHIGVVTLAVGNLERSLAFYTDAIGFALLQRTDGEATLGVPETPLLHLVERAGASPAPQSATGLYHVAILVPTPADLG